MLKLLLTCEHGGNSIPPAYRALFEGHDALLATHRGYDIGALDLFNHLKDLTPDSFFAVESRLLVELNRSVGQEDLFSGITGKLTEEEKNVLLQKHYYPFRNQVEQVVQGHMAAGNQVLHVAVHSFTPELNGEIRQADIGLLYDPERGPEHLFCSDWKKALELEAPEFQVRYNYPYLGTADGFPTYLRHKFDASQYGGIELEVNQKYAQEAHRQWHRLKVVLRKTLRSTFEKHSQGFAAQQPLTP
ncbi:N-formylglutamate amidohydrolase [Botryobacter ruber]|uniref:N-formylglutamate amidohydrolase n=1 Tax=Botryobacter ruber TaxID=2171629 RepID=UPI000E0ADFBA|nr:N-formylglutamate amidohydrolase [Botryobacter ruber]